MTDPRTLFDQIKARLTAQPLDDELVEMFRYAVGAVQVFFPADLQVADAEEREAYVADLEARLEALASVFAHAENPTRALQNLVICLHCVERLRGAQFLTGEQAAKLHGRVLSAYVHHAPQITRPH